MKYIFVTGAPGSKWSSVIKNIYYSPDIDRSDYREEWTYYHDASGEMQLMHLGAYFDPGMACPLPEDLTVLTREQLEETFAYPFQSQESQGIRIIKSHIFSNHIDYLRKLFPEIPIVIVSRGDDACLGWWVKCGHFNITYPDYRDYFKDLKNMASIIKSQNLAIRQARAKHWAKSVEDNHDLCLQLGIDMPPREYKQNYQDNDIEVGIL